jgi:hypothetical protein
LVPNYSRYSSLLVIQTLVVFFYGLVEIMTTTKLAPDWFGVVLHLLENPPAGVASTKKLFLYSHIGRMRKP